MCSSSNKHDREVEHTSADTDSEGEASPARPTTKDRVPPDGDAHRPEMPQHVTDADELDLFLQQNLVKERACSSFCAKGVRKDLLKLIIEGDLLEVSLDEQQLLASLWYQLNKWKRDHQPSSSGGPATTTTTGDEAPNDDDSLSEMSDSELEPNGDSDWSEGDNEQADPSLEKVGGAGAKPQRNPAMAKKEKLVSAANEWRSEGRRVTYCLLETKIAGAAEWPSHQVEAGAQDSGNGGRWWRRPKWTHEKDPDAGG